MKHDKSKQDKIDNNSGINYETLSRFIALDEPTYIDVLQSFDSTRYGLQ